MWKEIPGTEGNYSANDETGEIRGNNRKGVDGRQLASKILKPTILNSGYNKVSLMMNGVRSEHTAHRLIAKTFLDDFQEGLDVNHKDCDKLNNRKSNLEMMTRSENLAHAKANGLCEPTERQLQTRKNISQISKTVNSKPVAMIYPEDKVVVEEFESLSAAARKYNLEIAALSRAALGKQNTSYGYEWRFISNECND